VEPTEPVRLPAEDAVLVEVGGWSEEELCCVAQRLTEIGAGGPPEQTALFLGLPVPRGAAARLGELLGAAYHERLAADASCGHLWCAYRDDPLHVEHQARLVNILASADRGAWVYASGNESRSVVSVPYVEVALVAHGPDDDDSEELSTRTVVAIGEEEAHLTEEQARELGTALLVAAEEMQAERTRAEIVAAQTRLRSWKRRGRSS
jgi:hypothetical protein